MTWCETFPISHCFRPADKLSGSFYIICASDIGGTCATGGSSFSFIGVGGTSAAAPAFAGIMALVNQNMVSNSLSGRQGNANFVLYPMSAAQTEANCNSSAGPASNCVFNDVVKGNNSVPCFAGTFNCSNTVAGSPNIGVLETVEQQWRADAALWDLDAAQDMTWRPASVRFNVTNLVNGWPAAVGSIQSDHDDANAWAFDDVSRRHACRNYELHQHYARANVNVNISVTGAGTAAHPITAATRPRGRCLADRHLPNGHAELFSWRHEHGRCGSFRRNWRQREISIR